MWGAALGATGRSRPPSAAFSRPSCLTRSICNRRRRSPMAPKPRIAHLAGSNATIQNSPPLVTSNKARAKYGLPALTDADGAPLRFDALRAQRLAAPVTVYVEQFSAHPLERDAAELTARPRRAVDPRGSV